MRCRIHDACFLEQAVSDLGLMNGMYIEGDVVEAKLWVEFLITLSFWWCTGGTRGVSDTLAIMDRVLPDQQKYAAGDHDYLTSLHLYIDYFLQEYEDPIWDIVRHAIGRRLISVRATDQYDLYVTTEEIIIKNYHPPAYGIVANTSE